MSSKPAEPHSIASQLVVLFTVAAALLLCSGVGVLYWIFIQHGFEEDNEVLADRMFALRSDMNRPGGIAAFNQELQRLPSSERESYWVRVIDSAGKTIAETPGMKHLVPAEVFPTAEKTGSTPPRGKHHRTAGKLLALASGVEEVNGEYFTLQVAQDRSRDDKFTRHFGALLAGVLALGVLAATFVAVTVTKRGLRPLTEMTRTLQSAGPNRLAQRVKAVGWPSELQPLATAFDELLERLEESFTRLSQFSADIAHELRTPIGNIRGEAEVALTRSRTAEEYREVLQSCVAECERLSGVIETLLFLARAEAADRQIERSLFDGRAAVEKIAAFYQPIAEERRITLSCSGEGAISGDALLFRRAVGNLIENSLSFTPDGGQISIAITTRGANTEVCVADTGNGIEPQHLPRVFDRFYRADSSRSSRGTGLGLALVKSIAELHGGSAAIRSQAGYGTTVTLSFPAA
ncbi:MAG: heavy metal sensor histidine kinase [Chthoniobacterales bacterium]